MSEQLKSLANLLSQILAEQGRQTALLQRMADQQLMLIQAMADEPEDPDALPLTYMDGTPCL
ncbi:MULTISPECIES: hypothetical protein [unclassified Pseudomonas]|uniref:hypothetical protein n=1 Tax=unclassified Pseudomonas TaxID=196821 RepID=UPI000871A3E5|nr:MULTISPECIES: hypothetical protein [unclassified Pseudomonas]SCW88816.1 hypothetical protein SAMN03159424_03970 [Pseudomonas sp. NFACC05-1]SDB54338.1 hypothetical protein SAMN03159290_04182 [Pseudomonas sp. NFACC13-1]